MKQFRTFVGIKAASTTAEQSCVQMDRRLKRGLSLKLDRSEKGQIKCQPIALPGNKRIYRCDVCGDIYTETLINKE